MKKRWMTMILTLALCAAKTTSVLALEDMKAVFPSAAAEVQGRQSEGEIDTAAEESAVTNTAVSETSEADANPALPEIAEAGADLALPEIAEAGADLALPEIAEAGADLALPEPDGEAAIPLMPESEKLPEAELTIDSVEILDDPEGGLPLDITDLWDTMPAADAGQTETALNAANFPDEAFRSCLKGFDKDGSGGFSAEEIAAVTEIDVIGKNIRDLTGLAYFTELTDLYCDNNQLTALDVSHNAKLKCLTCTYNQLTGLDLQANAKLFSLVCSNNQIAALNLSKNKALQDLRCAGNQLQALDISQNSMLAWLDCSRNHLSALDASKHENLCYLFCGDNQLLSLNVKGAAKLQWLECQQNQLAELDVSDALNVNASNDSAYNLLNCSDNRLTSLDVSNKSYFKGLVCSNNAITELDLSTNQDLRQLECANNALTSLDVSGNGKLQTLDCSGNQLTSLDLSALSITATTVLPNCSGQKLSANLNKTESGYQADLNSVIGSSHLLRLTEEELQADDCAEKSVLGNLILLTQEGELKDGVLTFASGQVPETIELVYATGYRKKEGEKDVLLEIQLHCHTHVFEQVKKEPSCIEDGWQQEVCMECGTVSARTELPANGKHSYGPYTVIRQATIFEAGLRSRTCSVCGYVESEPIQKLNGSVELTAGNMPVQVSEKVSVQSLVTGLRDGDYVTSWSSSDPDVAVISTDGTILAKKTGTVNITVTTKSGATAVMAVNVQTNTVATERISGLEKNVTVAAGKKLRLTPVLSPISSQQKPTYESSNKKIAKVSAKGVVKGIKKGTVKITVKSGSQKFVVKVKVTAPAVKKIKNIPAKKTLKKGTTFQLKPRLTPTGCSQKISCKSSNKKVATVSAKGKIKAKKKGTARITITAGNVKAVCRISVK